MRDFKFSQQLCEWFNSSEILYVQEGLVYSEYGGGIQSFETLGSIYQMTQH